MSGKNSRARRADAKRQARADVYDSRGGAMQANPFDGAREARIYAAEYAHWRTHYWEMERQRTELEAVYGAPAWMGVDMAKPGDDRTTYYPPPPNNQGNRRA